MPQIYRLLPKTGSSLAEEWLDLGLAHQLAGRFAEAEQAYLKGLRADPSCAPILNNLAVMAAQQHETVYTIAVDGRPPVAARGGELHVALQRLERALLFAEAEPTIWYNRALALLEAERADEALAAIDRSIEFGESADSLCVKGMVLTSLGLAAEAVAAYDRALDKQPDHPQAGANAIFARTLMNSKPEDNLAARRRWHDAWAFKGERRPHANDRAPDRPLRVGYVGGDFKMHSAAFFFGTAVLNHDRAAVEPHCYMTLPCDPKADAQTKLFMDRTAWRDISAKTDDEAEAMIRADGIDILVELAGHTNGNRLALFTRKPAPVQCHAWGFAHGSGCPEIDWFLADPYAVPQDERRHFAERIWDLPGVVGYTPPEYGQPGASPPPVGRDGTFTFGVFGRFEKMSPQALEAWHKVLLRVPGSRLSIKDAMMRRPYVVRRVREAMKGVDPRRLLFVEATSHSEQMLAYQQADLVLDTFPHSGGATGFEMIYMGVPVLTLYNGQVGGRTVAVALKAIGRGGWIAESINDYVNKAVALATEGRAELAAARGELRKALLDSPLCGARYCRAVEEAYRRMWWQWCGHRAADAEAKSA